MSEVFIKGVSPSTAKMTFNSILKGLRTRGYDIDLLGEPEIITGDHIVTQFHQKYIIYSCVNDMKTKRYHLSADTVMTVSLFGYVDQHFAKTIKYNLGAKIEGTSIDWEGEDNSLYQLRDIFIEDISNSLINDLSDYDFITEVEDLVPVSEDINKRLENFAIRIYEGLYKKIKEDTSGNIPKEASLEDLDMKIDIIMDALGLKEEEEEKEETVETTDEVIKEIPPVEFEEKEETRTTEEIPEE